jgi:hypothetical protein
MNCNCSRLKMRAKQAGQASQNQGSNMIRLGMSPIGSVTVQLSV